MKTYVCFRLEILIIKNFDSTPFISDTLSPSPLQLFQSNPWKLKSSRVKIKSSRVYRYVTKKILLLSGMNSDQTPRREHPLNYLQHHCLISDERTDLTF